MVAKSNKIKKNAVIKKMRATLGNATESYLQWLSKIKD